MVVVVACIPLGLEKIGYEIPPWAVLPFNIGITYQVYGRLALQLYLVQLFSTYSSTWYGVIQHRSIVPAIRYTSRNHNVELAASIV